ncbi:14516_t:CDS:2, partial [Cetraspora pellucida]
KARQTIEMELVETQDLYCTTCDKYKDRKSTRQKKHKSEQFLIEDQDQDEDVVYEHVEIDSLVESVVYALNEYHDPLNKENTLAFCFGCITDVGLLEMLLKQIANLLIDHIEDTDNYKW